MIRSTLAFGLLVGFIGIQLGCQTDSAYKAPPPPKVTTAKPVIDTVPIFLTENGETEAVEQAVVQARVRGILKEILIDPDSVVEKETPLFQIDPEEYLAALASSEAAVGSANAALVSAEAALGVADARIAASQAAIDASKAKFDRMVELRQANAISKSEYDEAEAAWKTDTAAKQGSVAAKAVAEADIKNAQAAVEKVKADLIQAKLNLRWTKVIAPIAGRVTKTLVKEGNLVEDGTDLLEIVKNDPIWVNFNVNERFLLNLERASDRENSLEDLSSIKVRLKRSGDTGFLFEGSLNYVDPKVDQDTGTMQLRAVFDNKPGKANLLPGLFVRVQVQIGEAKDALLIPERAIGRDQVGAFVFIVDADNKAVRNNVELGTKYNGMIVIVSGLDPGDTVIVDGLQRVRTGAEVDPSELESSTEPEN